MPDAVPSSPRAPLSRAQILDSTSPHWPGVVECNESVRVKASDIVDWGFTQANTIPPLKAQILKLDKELKLARSEISELNGVVESNAAEIEGLKEDLAVNIAGYDAEKAEKEERIRERDEANEQLEFLEGELEGVRAEETRLRAEVKSQGEELRDVTKNRDDLDDEVRRLKDLSNAREIEASKLRAQLSDLRQQHAVALSDAQRYMAEADRSRERVGTASAKASAAIEEAAKLRKWQDWAKASEVTALTGELEVVRQERDMLQRDLQARLAEMRRVTTQNEEHVKDLKACRADLFAREGRLGRVEAELAALQRSAQQVEVDLTVAKEQLERRKEELAKASMDNVKLRGQFESEKLRWQNTVNTIRATQQTEEEKTRNQHAREMEASRRDAQAAWRLAKELEQRVLQQAQLFANNRASLSSAMNDARKIMADVAPNSPLIAGKPVASKDRMEALQAQLASTTLERDALKREVVAQRTPTVVEAQPAAIAAAPAVRPNAAAAAVTATAVRKFQKAGQS